MKKVGSIVRWIIGIFVILGGLGFITGSAVSGILLILMGLVILPPITKRIPQFKGRKPVLVVGCIVLFFAGILTAPDTQSTGIAQGTTNSDSSIQTDFPQASPTNTPAALDDQTADELRTWISESISSTGTVTAKDKDIKKWAKISENECYPVWESVVLSELRSNEDLIGFHSGAADVSVFISIANYLNGAISLYESLYSNSTVIGDIRELASDFDQAATASRELERKYPFDLSSAAPYSGTFYVTQRLDKAYSDNILGALQKEFDSYQAQSTSDWVAYDVEYVMGTAFPGDSLYVLHADNLNPFSQSDAYELYYIDTGETTELVNSRGFTSTVPVYQLVENTDAIIADQQAYSTNWSQCFVNLEKMKRLLGADGYADLQADAEQITGDISGAYYEEGAASGIYIDLSASDFSDPASAGSFHYLADGDGFGGAALYEVAANIYCARTIENETYIFGFSKQGSEVVMDLYSAGEHSSMIKREDGSEGSSNVETPTEATVAQNANDSGKYGDYNLHVYEGSYSDFPESVNINLAVQPNETEFYCELFWIYGKMLEEGVVVPGIPTQLSEGTTITVDLETNGGIHVVLDGSGSDPFHYEYDLFQ